MSAGEIIAFDKYHGFLVGNQDTTRGLIVVQEWQKNPAGGWNSVFSYLFQRTRRSPSLARWGLNEQIKNTSKRFANQGFLVLAPDLYYGKIAHSADEANHLMNNLDWQDAQAMIAEGVKVLKSKGVSKVGITGFCMPTFPIPTATTIQNISGWRHYYRRCCQHPGYLCRRTLLWFVCLSRFLVFLNLPLSKCPRLSCLSKRAGIPPLEAADPKNIKVPVQAHFGELDDQKGFSDPENAKKLEETLKQTGIHYEFHWYKNAGVRITAFTEISCLPQSI
ncbi:hypothetical protein BC937DRAFT_95332 [Endogone sp. FLAS-F59071]|nr:hypothetical protein BC937DRAFT_95332 [Endogone sp. FLAS-F59071]|eukprot:RUS20385.1 hypothetical protein BC937DRAFT_95332 [Endogone sp. FLAS-F59071]